MKQGGLRTIALLVAAAVAWPAAAQLAASPPAPAVASYGAIDTYYATHGNASIWLKDAVSRAAAEKLPAILRRAEVDGLDNGAALAASVEGALSRGQAADDRIISSAWVRYVQALKWPVTRVSYGDPALAPRTPSTASILDKAGRATSLPAHVERVASVNPLYSALREQALSANAQSDPRVRSALDQLRLVPAKGRAILVDVPSAELRMIEDGRVVDSMKVIVGKKAQPTPMLAGTIHYVTFNPYWHIPQDIARKRVAPVVLKRGVGYLKLARYQTVADFRERKNELVDPESIDWEGVADGSAEVHVRQLAGPQNMMGKMKFGFVNDHGIFLHDTPRKDLFAKDKRFLSNGCIRLEHAERLAAWLLGREAAPPSDDSELQVRIHKGVPIYVTYLTANVRDDQLAFADDIYGLDPAGNAAAPAVAASSY